MFVDFSIRALLLECIRNLFRRERVVYTTVCKRCGELVTVVR